MFVRERFRYRQTRPATVIQIAQTNLGEKHIQQIHLRYSRRNGAQLQRAFIGAALEHHIGKLCTRGIGKACD